MLSNAIEILQTLLNSNYYLCGSALVKEGLFDIVKNTLKDAEESVRLSGYFS